MGVSDLIYLAFIPIGIWITIFLVIETKEKVFHRYTLKKIPLYLYSALVVAILIVIIVIVAILI